jgi:hypothetical protein
MTGSLHQEQIDQIRGRMTITTEMFITRARKFHGSRFDYAKSRYVNRRTKIAIECKEHGIFRQRPDHHLSGNGCPKCSEVHTTSESEKMWLDSRRISKNNRHVRLVVNKRVYVVDAYIPRSKTVYEFYGDFWHGNPKVYEKKEQNPQKGVSFGYLHKQTKNRERRLKAAGYKIVSIWESEWKGSEE